jgi:hypothetical protein
VSLSGQRVLVVGAGVTGLAAALLASERGAAVEVVECAGEVGGLLAPQPFRGIDCDLGSHRVHAEALEDPEVARLLRAVVPESRPRRGALLLSSRRIPYPPSWLDLARGLGGAGPRAALGFAARAGRLRGWEGARTDERDVGFADFVRARVGDDAFELFYRPYVEKVWGLPADELSQTVAKARVSTTSPMRLVLGGLRALFRRREEREARSFLYPRAGFSSIARDLAERLYARGVPIRTSASPSAGTDERGRFDRVIHTGLLRDASGVSLLHRGVYLVYLAFPVPRGERGAHLGPHETYYAPEARWWFGRVSELGRYSPSLVPPGESILCVEVPEGRWGRGRAFDRGPMLDALVEQLRESGIVPSGLAPLAAAQRFIADVYPLYTRGWTARWEEALDRVEALGNVVAAGRQGLYLHCNVDHCIEMARDAVDHIEAEKSADSYRVVARARLGLRVRD